MPKLQVTARIWSGVVSYRTANGKQKRAKSLQETREYAAQNGYSGIEIKFK